MKKNRNNLYVSILLSLAFILPGVVSAYDKTTISVDVKNDFVVEPGKTEIIANPGDTIVKDVSITNRTNKVVNFELTTEDLVGSDDPKQPVTLLGTETGPYSVKDFIKPEINQFSLAFGEKITIPVTISIPKNVEPRGYYGALIISNRPDVQDQIQETGTTKLISRIGSLFLVKINGEGKEEGTVTDFKVIGPSKLFYSSRPEGFEIAFKNTGTVHLVPYGRVTVKNMLGKKVADLPVDAYFALPDSTRYRDVDWSGGFSFGRYTATLALHKGYGDESANTATAQIAFWVLPWKLLAGIFIAILLLVSIFYYVATRFELKKK